MGGKKAPVTLSAWCWYCDREFEDEKVLISHQRAKHFRCPQCPRRLNTAGGLAVHLQQVHKSEPSTLENTLPGRDTFEVEIYGMEGIPDQDLVEYQSRKATRTQQDLARSQMSKKPRIDKGILSIKTLQSQLNAFRRLRQTGPLGPTPIPPVATAAATVLSGPHPVPVPFARPAPRVPQRPPPPTAAPHLRAQQDGLKQRLVYTDSILSPEEKLARDPQYAFIEWDQPYDTGLPSASDGFQHWLVPSSWGPPALGVPGLPPRPRVQFPPEPVAYTPHYPLHPALLSASVDPTPDAAAPPRLAGTKRARADDLF